MRICSCLALVALGLALGACGGAENEERSSGRAPGATTRAEVDADGFVGFVWSGGGGSSQAQLARLDADTLAPTSQPLPVDAQGVTATSPDGRTLAVAASETPEVELFDVARMRRLGTVDLGMAGFVSRLSWPEPGTLYAAVGPSTVVRVDARTRRPVETRQVEGVLLGEFAEIRGGMLTLVAPWEEIGELEAVVFRGETTSSVRLRGIVGGSKRKPGDTPEELRVLQNIPGLAVDPAGRRALVVPAGGEVAEIGLDDLRVTRHGLSQPVSLLERVRNWLEPVAHAKGAEGPARQAVWMPSGLVAVTGADYTISDERRVDANPAGLLLVDPRDWSVRTVDERTDGVLLAGKHLLAFEPACDGAPERVGFAVYDLRGKERFRVCRDGGFDPQVVGGRAYLGFEDNTRFEVVDLDTGETVARLRTPHTTSLLTN